MELPEGALTAQVSGDIGLDGKVLVIRRIRVDYRLMLAEEHRATAERVHEVHADHCPVARTLRGCVEIVTELGFQPGQYRRGETPPR